MKLYLDTADRGAAESLLATGLFAGVTTNPTILQRASKGVADVGEIYRWAIEAGAREVFFQAWGEDAATLIERGQRLRELGPEVVVKFVATRAGATRLCRAGRARHPTLLTAIYDPGQAIVAAAAGATYIAPYLGRLNDAGRDGIAEVIAMHEVLAATGSTTKVLLASIRSVPTWLPWPAAASTASPWRRLSRNSSSPIRPPPRRRVRSRTPSARPRA